MYLDNEKRTTNFLAPQTLRSTIKVNQQIIQVWDFRDSPESKILFHFLDFWPGLRFYDASHLWDGEGGWPLWAQDVQADGAVAVDVGVVDPGGERELGRLEGVVCGEVDVQEENTSCNKTTTQ